jgi:hypothetical protein
MMIRPMDLKGLPPTDFEPVAELFVSPGTLRDHGIRFALGQDDMDDYEFASFLADGRGAFMLMRYLQSPSPNMSLLLADTFRRSATLAQTISDIAGEFDGLVTGSRWREAGEEASLIFPEPVAE